MAKHLMGWICEKCLRWSSTEKKAWECEWSHEKAERIIKQRMNSQLIKEIRGEVRFLNSAAIKDLVYEADLMTCHELSKPIEDRKKKLKKQLKAYNLFKNSEEKQ